MDVRHRKEDQRGIFFIENNKEVQAALIYSINPPSIIVLEHTEVDDALRGQNVGYALVVAAVEFARKNNMQILPMCTFAKSVFERKEELQDVLA